MGTFDYVNLPCPRCGEVIEEQSKGGACELRHYSIDNAPPFVLGYLAWPEDIFECANCKTTFVLKANFYTQEKIQ